MKMRETSRVQDKKLEDNNARLERVQLLTWNLWLKIVCFATIGHILQVVLAHRLSRHLVY
jgi:hypothetical protein